MTFTKQLLISTRNKQYCTLIYSEIAMQYGRKALQFKQSWDGGRETGSQE